MPDDPMSPDVLRFVILVSLAMHLLASWRHAVVRDKIDALEADVARLRGDEPDNATCEPGEVPAWWLA